LAFIYIPKHNILKLKAWLYKNFNHNNSAVENFQKKSIKNSPSHLKKTLKNKVITILDIKKSKGLQKTPKFINSLNPIIKNKNSSFV
jgi:hypothetical protein